MSNGSNSTNGTRLSLPVSDDDNVLMVRSNARQLLAEVSEVDMTVPLSSLSSEPLVCMDKGCDIVEVVGLLPSAGPLTTACAQIHVWQTAERPAVHHTRGNTTALVDNGSLPGRGPVRHLRLLYERAAC